MDYWQLLSLLDMPEPVILQSNAARAWIHSKGTQTLVCAHHTHRRTAPTHFPFSSVLFPPLNETSYLHYTPLPPFKVPQSIEARYLPSVTHKMCTKKKQRIAENADVPFRQRIPDRPITSRQAVLLTIDSIIGYYLTQSTSTSLTHRVYPHFSAVCEAHSFPTTCQEPRV